VIARKRGAHLLFTSLLIFVSVCAHADTNQPNETKLFKFKDGDIVFQTSLSSQSRAIQLATKSIYSHMGIVFGDYILEAVQPVKKTPIKEWIARGQNGKYVVKRVKNTDKLLTPKVLAKMKTTGDSFIGKDYDLAFEWSDDKIYCSELVWKIYKQGAEVEIGKLQKLGEFDLSHEEVKKKLHERYKNAIPYDERVISPVAIFDDERLTTVYSN
jgi:uncharacterized protein YycO